MGVRSVAGQELAALVTASEARTPRAQPGTQQNPAVSANGTQRAKGDTPPTEDKLAKAAKTVNKALSIENTGVRLRIDKESSRVIVQLLDAKNNVIKQIPPEELLRIASSLRKLEGLLFNKKA